MLREISFKRNSNDMFTHIDHSLNHFEEEKKNKMNLALRI